MPLLWLSVAFAGGILLGSLIRLPWPVWLGLALLLIVLAFFEKKLGISWRYYLRWRAFSRVAVAAVLAALCLGGLRYALSQLPPGENDLASHTGERLELSGLVNHPPQARESYTSILLQVDEPWQGVLMVRLPAGKDVQYGDRLQLEGDLQAFPSFWSPSYTAYLERLGVGGVMYFPFSKVVEREAGSRWLMALYRTRERGLDILKSLLPPKEAALISGILLGIDDDLPEATLEAFRATGTAHLTAISGVNIAIVISLVFGLFRKLAGRLGGLALSILAITAFTLLVGAPASAVRAALMGGLGLAGEQIGRRRAGIHALCLTAAVMTAFNPAVLWDAGFQLSFSATLGILWLNEPLQKGFTRLLESALPGELARKLARPLGDYLVVTLAAQITTLPILAITFGQLSLSAPLVNPLILPAQPAAMALGGLALAGGWIAPAIGQVFAWLAWPLLAYTLKVVEAIGAIPGLLVYVQTGWDFAAAYYALLAFFTSIYPRLGAWKLKVRPVVILLTLGLAASVLWRLAADRPDQKLTVTLIPNPGGPAVLIRLPGGNFLLVNGGSSGRELGAALEAWLPPTQRRLAGVFLTSAENNSLNGLPDVLERWQPDRVYWPEDAARSSSGKDIANRLGLGGETLETGMVFDLGAGVRLSIPAASQSEAALRLTFGNFDALLSSGIGIDDFQEKPDGLDYILLTPAHLESLQPDGLRPLGAGIELAEGQTQTTQGTPWLALAQQSWIRLVSDGEQVWLSRQP